MLSKVPGWIYMLTTRLSECLHRCAKGEFTACTLKFHARTATQLLGFQFSASCAQLCFLVDSFRAGEERLPPTHNTQSFCWTLFRETSRRRVILPVGGAKLTERPMHHFVKSSSQEALEIVSKVSSVGAVGRFPGAFDKRVGTLVV